MGEGAKALSLIENAHSIAPTDSLIGLMLFEAYESQGDRSIESVPGWWIWERSVFLHRARCWLESQEFRRAAIDLTLFVQSESAESASWSDDKFRDVSRLYIDLLKHCQYSASCFEEDTQLREKVVSYFVSASRSNQPKIRAAAHFALGQVYSTEGALELAISNYRMAVLNDPSNLKYRVHLGAALCSAGQYEMAELELLEALRRANTDKDKAWIFGQMGYLYLLSGQNQKAVQSFEASVKVDTSDSSYLVGLSRAYWNAGRAEDAIRTLDEVIRAEPRQAAAWIYLGIFYREQQDWDHAIPMLRTAVDLEPRNTAYRFELAYTLDLAGQKTEAAKQYQLILDQDPMNENVQRLLHNATHEK